MIGATNRVDAIDPALRRPGRWVATSIGFIDPLLLLRTSLRLFPLPLISCSLRRCSFDRELNFALPSKAARRQILRIHTKDWYTLPTCAVLV